MSRLRSASGLAVEVDDSTGYTHRPRIASSESVDPLLNPKANASPAVRLPVRESGKWRVILESGTNIDMRVWKDGQRQPIDTLVDVQDAPGATVLTGAGARELDQRVELQKDQQAVHEAVKDLVDNNLTYARNVDTPTTSTETNTTLATLTSTADFLARVQAPLATDPWEVSGGNLQFKGQTCFTVEAEAKDRGDVDTLGGFTNQSNNDGISWDSTFGETAEYDFTTDYDIPRDQFVLAYRHHTPGGQDIPTVEVLLDGESFAGSNNSTNTGDFGWDTIRFGDTAGGVSSTGSVPDPIPAGDHTLKLKSVDPGVTVDDNWVWDVVAPRDDGSRLGGFSYTDDGSVDTNDALAGPELFPDELQVRFGIVEATQAVTGIRAEATLDAADSSYTHYVSNDQGDSYTSGTGANLETDSPGTAHGPGITYKAGLSRHGSQSTTPTSGINGQTLQALTLKADLEDMPILVNRSFDGHISDVLTEWADVADSLWEATWNGSKFQIEWTAPGQRSSSKTPQIASYSATKTLGDEYQKAVVYGQSDVQVVDERFESSHGVAVSLVNDRLQPGSEVVTDPDTGRRYRSGDDYTVDYQAGDITVLAAGQMADATAFDIDYRYQAFGEFDDGTADPDVAPPVEIPGLSSDLLCAMAARQVVNEVNTPLHTAEVTVPNDEVGYSVVEAIDPAIVPTGGNELHIRDVQNTPQATVLTLGSRRTVGDVVGRIRAQVSAVSRKA